MIYTSEFLFFTAMIIGLWYLIKRYSKNNSTVSDSVSDMFISEKKLYKSTKRVNVKITIANDNSGAAEVDTNAKVIEAGK